MESGVDRRTSSNTVLSRLGPGARGVASLREVRDLQRRLLRLRPPSYRAHAIVRVDGLPTLSKQAKAIELVEASHG